MSNEAQEAMQEVSKEAGEGTESGAHAFRQLVDKIETFRQLADKIENGAQSDKLGQAETKTDNVADIRQAQKEKDAEGVRVEVTNETKHVAHAFRQLADKIEEGELNNLDFAIVIPKLVNGDMPMLFLGNPIPNVMLEGLLHRMLTKMAFQ